MAGTTKQEQASQQTGDIEAAVRDRYARGAEAVEPALCCPTAGYDTQYLKVIPQEILDKDYGCGDPSKHVGEGDTVLDLGSGGGKICYILSQKVGPTGRVIGVDFNDPMLALARKYQQQVADAVGWANVSFHKARIQDLALDLDAAAAWLGEQPIADVEQMSRFEAWCDRQRRERPLIADNSVDAIVSNCVLNLVQTEQKRQLFAEMFRVLRPGGRAIISDIVCDETPTEAMMNDPELWSGCISGAFREDVFPAMFEQAGFQGVEILTRGSEPWQTIQGIAFREMTVRAYKAEPAEDELRNRSVIYKGPWKQVRDEAGRVYTRGERTAVGAAQYAALTNPAGPYAGQFAGGEAGHDGSLGSLNVADSADAGGCCESDGCC